MGIGLTILGEVERYIISRLLQLGAPHLIVELPFSRVQVQKRSVMFSNWSRVGRIGPKSVAFSAQDRRFRRLIADSTVKCSATLQLVGDINGLFSSKAVFLYMACPTAV